MKGFEVDAPEPFTDNDGKERDRIRAVWWKSQRDQVLNDRPQVFRHYSNLPPIVATDVRGSPYHRRHRCPGTRPVTAAHTAPGPAPTGGAAESRSAAGRMSISSR
jgi:hypothetical protein